MGSFESKVSDTINWNNINTNELSSTIPDMKNISLEAKELINKLNLPEISDNNSDINFNNIFQNNTNIDNNNKTKINNDDITSSPFITSEMYNNIIKKYNNIDMTGGGTIDNNNEGETSSTSSSSENIKPPLKNKSKKSIEVEPNEPKEQS